MATETSLIVELYGKLADPCGRIVTIALPAAGCSTAELPALVGQHHPALAQLLAATRVRVSLNDSLVTAAARVQPGDRVALLPPVSGG